MDTMSDCTIYQTASFIGKRWTLVILLELYRGDSEWRRYSEIKRGIKEITPKLLSARLKELESENLIKKRVDSSQVPIKSEYSLTDSGKDFISIIQDMKQWALKWKIKNKVCEGMDCKNCSLSLSS